MILPAVLLLGAAMLGMNSGGLALVMIAAGFVAVLTVPHAVSGWVRISGTRLTASRPFLASESPRGGVDLSALLRISLVGRKYGHFVDRGLPIFRSLFRIQDRHGGEAWIEAWGWSSQEQLFGELRQAARSCGAHVDELTFRRLGFSDNQRTGGTR
jgi:hypothetical protein